MRTCKAKKEKTESRTVAESVVYQAAPSDRKRDSGEQRSAERKEFNMMNEIVLRPHED